MSEPASILLFDNPLGMQLIEEVLRKIGVPYETPPYSAEEPVLMIQVKSNRSSKKVFEACKEYFPLQSALTWFSLVCQTFLMTRLWYTC